jgi:tetratricopeptide (TPR) repeat protein
MSDPHREQAVSASDPAGATRDARIEQLLLTGLDHYFAGRHNEAINVWTRVLFLDRSHARARAYIERARSAIAEGQRECDELLQRGMAAFHEGEAHVARRLLTRAAERAGSQQEEALAVLGRIERLEAAAADSPVQAARLRGIVAETERVPAERPLMWLVFVVFVAALGTVTVLVATHRGRAPSWMTLLPRETREATSFVPASLPVPQPGEVALVRARSLFARGRLSDALQILEDVPKGDQGGAEADSLRGEIQRMLLDAAGARPPSVSPAPVQPGATR